MSKRQKRLAHIRQNPKNVSLDDLRQVLEDYGFEHKHTVGSHHTFAAIIGGSTHLLSVPFSRPVKPIYVKKALQLIHLVIAAQGGDDAPEEQDA